MEFQWHLKTNSTGVGWMISGLEIAQGKKFLRSEVILQSI